ncbi:MAG: hypothetical protein IPP73_10035 [Chitinophagaceae bacterium]|nr:hypothetical protein [Chitinophagaceae bacterium]
MIFIITAVSNGSNLTDGLMGLQRCQFRHHWNLFGNFRLCQWCNRSSGWNISTSCTYFTWESIHIHWSLDGSCIGFLWYTSILLGIHGNTGSLTLGGIIASLAIIVKRNYCYPFSAGVFVEILV